VLVFGYCPSALVLRDSVEGVVQDRGGEVLRREHTLKGAHESLTMSVVVPFLFGIPPELDLLR